MKVSEVIDQLKVGDEVWLKGKVNEKVLPTEESGCSTIYPIHVSGFGYIGKDTEISLTEPKNEKVEVPDYVAEWYEHHKHKTLEAKFMHIENAADDRVVNWYEKCKGRHNNPRGNSQEILAMMDLFGYEVEKEPRWVVKYIPPFIDDFRYYSMDDEIFDITESSWTSDKEDAYPFPEKEKAEAVAMLVEGSVEEV